MSSFINKSDYGPAIKQNILDRITEYDDTMLDEAETQAISLMTGYLNSRYDTENIFNKTGGDRHPVIVQYCVDIVLYTLHSRIRPNQVPEIRKDRYDTVMRWLEKVSAGKINPDLPLPATAEEKDYVLYGSNDKRENHI